MMSIIQKLKPPFWDHPENLSGPFRHMFNFRRIWKMTVCLMAVVTLFPLITITLIDYNFTQKSIESEILLRTARIASNFKRSLSFFLTERKSALDFLVHDNSFESLNDETHLSRLLYNLQQSFGGGFEDLSLIDANGHQRTYVGPHKLEGKDYSGQPWFDKVREKGIYISDVFMGFRQSPHLVIAVKYDLPDGSFYVLRSSVGTVRFNNQLAEMELSGRGDAFIINQQGILQTPARYYGNVLEKFPLEIPQYSEKTEVFEKTDSKGEELIIGYAYIPDTPFILMVIKHKEDLMSSWHETRMKLIGFLFFNITVILLVIFSVTTYMVNNLYITDQNRLTSLHELEYASKMASIGRLAAGIAHEINNPLAIINEKAGLMKDLFAIKKEYANDSRLSGIVDSILSSVKRCATITKRLLGFARQPDISIQSLKVGELIREVLSFTGKEAEYRSIDVVVDIPENIPEIESDRSKLQQIFLNLINNSFAAMEADNSLYISAQNEKDGRISINVCDTGCGIPAPDLERIFEPFFSTKTQKGGTGLGLSITYNLVREIGGTIEVHSTVGEGTTFVVTLPLKMKEKKENTL